MDANLLNLRYDNLIKEILTPVTIVTGDVNSNIKRNAFDEMLEKEMSKTDNKELQYFKSYEKNYKKFINR